MNNDDMNKRTRGAADLMWLATVFTLLIALSI